MDRAAGSSFDGERLTAQELLASRGLRWRDVLDVRRVEPALLAPARHRKTVVHEIIVDNQVAITEWVEGFLQSLIIHIHKLTGKQAVVLADLCDKCCIARCGAAV